MRYFLDIAYDGTNFHGWQIQNNAVTIQGKLNEALSTILGANISTIGSGRTDTGVHALSQVVHFDVDHELDDKLVFRLNSILGHEIAVKSLVKVTNEAHARFDATSRGYLYMIHMKKDPFLVNRSYLFTRKLDLDLINKSCDIIKKWSDFEAFSKVQTDVNHFNCEIFDAKWELQNDRLYFSVSANRFLRNMIRAMVGTMLDLGENKISLIEFQSILESKDRKRAGKSAPAHGLYLRDINYPGNIFLS